MEVGKSADTGGARKNFIMVNESFVCGNCGFANEKLSKGCRNHCRQCLFSLHVDLLVPGDRLSDCLGLMRPIEVDKSGKKGYVIVHKCEKCGKIMRNKAAEDDDFQRIIDVSLKNDAGEV